MVWAFGPCGPPRRGGWAGIGSWAKGGVSGLVRFSQFSELLTL